jgi:hypothetical protein
LIELGAVQIGSKQRGPRALLKSGFMLRALRRQLMRTMRALRSTTGARPLECLIGNIASRGALGSCALLESQTERRDYDVTWRFGRTAPANWRSERLES